MTPAVLKAQVEDLAKQVDAALAVIDLPAAAARLAELEGRSSAEGLWDDRAAAEELLRSVERCREEVEEGRRLRELLDDAEAAAELALSCSGSSSSSGGGGGGGGESGAAEGPGDGGGSGSDALAFAAEGFSYVSQLRGALDAFELSRLLSGEFDSSDATVSIQAGAGGTEAMDWVSFEVLRDFFFPSKKRPALVCLLHETLSAPRRTTEIDSRPTYRWARDGATVEWPFFQGRSSPWSGGRRGLRRRGRAVGGEKRTVGGVSRSKGGSKRRMTKKRATKLTLVSSPPFSLSKKTKIRPRCSSA
jgi:hypothetical protein